MACVVWSSRGGESGEICLAQGDYVLLAVSGDEGCQVVEGHNSATSGFPSNNGRVFEVAPRRGLGTACAESGILGLDF